MSRLYVSNLLDSVRREDLEDEFSKYGALKNVYVSQTHTRYAFVDYEDETNANDAVSNMNDAEYFGSRIKVEVPPSCLSRFKGRMAPKPDFSCNKKMVGVPKLGTSVGVTILYRRQPSLAYDDVVEPLFR
ncbi:hypothetical protein QYM36_005840 [Artemia franciscana]|uniref:RRM domain-containing protein n=1 Tax=Artemia franciscana TaxID=6661 RepID=A0AA88I2D8_ARTSF|nr:hypothetical protein QYM36_005840 [Artemia franciscana]